MIDEEKSQNEKLANNLKESQAELSALNTKVMDWSDMNTKVMDGADWYHEGFLDYQRRYNVGLEDYQRLEGMYHETRKVKGTLELSLQKKLEYIEFLENQQSEFRDILVKLAKNL